MNSSEVELNSATAKMNSFSAHMSSFAAKMDSLRAKMSCRQRYSNPADAEVNARPRGMNPGSLPNKS
jgi:outer membrane murein-binding lipoprotein Lpp